MNTITKFYKTVIELGLQPIFNDDAPWVEVLVDGHTFWSNILTHETVLQIPHPMSQGAHSISVRLNSKSDLDPVQAVRITSLAFNGITSAKFIWHGRYRPEYPEPWATEQQAQGIVLDSDISNTDYLGWNGEWSLDFTVPVFSWIHKTENLGWIYD